MTAGLTDDMQPEGTADITFRCSYDEWRLIRDKLLENLDMATDGELVEYLKRKIDVALRPPRGLFE
jgi:hypothetical protein